MPQSMQVVRGLLAANPDYWPAKTNADGTTSSAYLRATVYEDRPRVRQKDGSYTDNPLGPVQHPEFQSDDHRRIYRGWQSIRPSERP